MRLIPDLEAVGQQDSVRRDTQAALVVDFKRQRLTADALVVAIESDDLNCMRAILDAFQQRRVLRIRRKRLRIPENRDTCFIVGKDICRNRLCFAVLLKDRGWHTKTRTEFPIYGQGQILDIRQGCARNLNPHCLTYTGTILRTGYLEWHLRRCHHRHRDCQTQDCRTQNRLDHRFASSLEPSP